MHILGDRLQERKKPSDPHAYTMQKPSRPRGRRPSPKKTLRAGGPWCVGQRGLEFFSKNYALFCRPFSHVSARLLSFAVFSRAHR